MAALTVSLLSLVSSVFSRGREAAKRPLDGEDLREMLGFRERVDQTTGLPLDPSGDKIGSFSFLTALRANQARCWARNTPNGDCLYHEILRPGRAFADYMNSA